MGCCFFTALSTSQHCSTVSLLPLICCSKSKFYTYPPSLHCLFICNDDIITLHSKLQPLVIFSDVWFFASFAFAYSWWHFLRSIQRQIDIFIHGQEHYHGYRKTLIISKCTMNLSLLLKHLFAAVRKKWWKKLSLNTQAVIKTVSQ